MLRKPKEVRIAAYGGGVNSTAMLIGLTKAGIILDAILFADTGGERPETYKFIRQFSKWLAANGQPRIRIVRKVTRDGKRQTLESDCLDRKVLPAITYGYRHCSQKFKIAPQDKWVNNCSKAKKAWKRGGKVVKYVGFDAGEQRRVFTGDPKYTYRHPLIEWNWSREICKEVIKAEGLCLPPKSSCFFCPNMKKTEILSLPKRLQNRAIRMEENAKATLREIKGLGRRYAWKDLINAQGDQSDRFSDLILYDNPCACID